MIINLISITLLDTHYTRIPQIDYCLSILIH